MNEAAFDYLIGDYFLEIRRRLRENKEIWWGNHLSYGSYQYPRLVIEDKIDNETIWKEESERINIIRKRSDEKSSDK